MIIVRAQLARSVGLPTHCVVRSPLHVYPQDTGRQNLGRARGRRTRRRVCYLHDLSGPISLRELKARGLPLAHPELIYSMPDHLVSSKPGQQESGLAGHARYIPVLREESALQHFSFFDIDDDRQGIIHVVGPEQGITLPGLTAVCGDSHTSTHGGIGALAWGVGTSDLTHLLATGCLVDQKPKMMRITFEGSLPSGVTAKDMILSVIAQYGCKLGVGYAIEYAGQSVTDMSIESRLTLCNLSIELGARWGIVAPDDATLSYLQGRAFTPKNEDFDRAADYWRSLRSDDDASFDREIVVDISWTTWGSRPGNRLKGRLSIKSSSVPVPMAGWQTLKKRRPLFVASELPREWSPG